MRGMHRVACAVIGAGALMAGASTAAAELLTRVALLTGTQETPPNASAAIGSARLLIDTDTNTITYRIAFTGLSATETAAHFHGPADPGVAAGVLYALPTGNVKSGSQVYAEAQEADLLAGRWYINIHTTAFPGGEIRGQIVSAVARLDGGQETPPNATPARGFGLFMINPNTNQMSFYIAYAGLGAPETAAHIHGMSLPGTAAGVLFALPAANPKVGTVTYAAAQEQQIIDGMTYVNIHTTAFPGGEIRGQIVTSVNPMDGSQEVPPVPTTAAGVTLVSLDRATNALGYDMFFGGLSSAQTAAHIHGYSGPGVSSGVVHNIGVGNPMRGTWPFGAVNSANVLGGLTYTNVHTMAFPGGEVRGQLNFARIIPCSPIVTDQPDDTTVQQGGTAMFGVTADPNAGGAPSYQWRRNGAPLSNGGAFSGVDTPTLTISPADAGHAGDYAVRVSNTCGSTLSDAATLVVAPSCDPDMDQNGVADQDDVAYLINVVGGGANPSGRDPDYDCNGVADQDDVAYLIDSIAGAPCPTTC